MYENVCFLFYRAIKYIFENRALFRGASVAHFVHFK